MSITNRTGQNGDISAGPRLASSHDYHVQVDSPCREAGDSEAVRLRWRDLDGERRIQGLAVDYRGGRGHYRILPPTLRRGLDRGALPRAK